MELEHMREVLATLGMGWTGPIYTELGVWACWVDDKGETVQNAVAWHPDTDWAQCGLVIEAMTAARWSFVITIHGDGATAGCQRWTGRGEQGFSERQESPCYAVSLAATRALEATDEQS